MPLSLSLSLSAAKKEDKARSRASLARLITEPDFSRATIRVPDRIGSIVTLIRALLLRRLLAKVDRFIGLAGPENLSIWAFCSLFLALRPSL